MSLENLCLGRLTLSSLKKIEETHPKLYEKRELIELFGGFKKKYQFKSNGRTISLELNKKHIVSKLPSLKEIKAVCGECNIDGVSEYPEDDNPYEIRTDIPKQYKLPPEMALFYSLCNGGTICGDPKTKFLPLEEFSGCVNVLYCIFPYMDETESELIKEPLMLAEWVTFYFDGNSVDNNCGYLLTNLNPKSKRFGQVLAYSSDDEGTLNLIALSFAEFIDKCLGFNHEEKNWSLCDEFNGFY